MSIDFILHRLSTRKGKGAGEGKTFGCPLPGNTGVLTEKSVSIKSPPQDIAFKKTENFPEDRQKIFTHKEKKKKKKMPPEKIDQKKKQFLKQKIAEQTEKVKKCKSQPKGCIALFPKLMKKAQQENFQNKRFLCKKNIALSAFPKTKTFML